MFLWQTTAKFLREHSAPDPPATLLLPDPENEAEVRHFLAKLSVLLREQPWPESQDLKKAVEALVDFTETRPTFISHYFPDTWSSVLTYSSTLDGYLQSFLYTTLNCISSIPTSQLSPLLPPLWTFLTSKEAMVAYTALQTLLAVCTANRASLLDHISADPTQLIVVVDLIRSEVDFLRNEAILFIKELCNRDEEMQKSLAFQGIFEALADIMQKEEGVVVSDCLALVGTLTSDFTRNYIREVPGFLVSVKGVVERGAQAQEAVNVVEMLLKDSRGEIIRNNQLSFSPLISSIVPLAFPVMRGAQQVPKAISLLCDLLRDNKSQQRDLSLLLLPAGSDFLSFFDVLLSYCLFQSNESLNWRLLSILAADPDLQTQMVSKITAVLGVGAEDNIGTFNARMMECLETGRKMEELCVLLEILIAGNDVSKELASSLPISSHSLTLLHRLCDLVTTSISAHSLERSLFLFRLLSVWAFRHPPSAHSLYSKLIAVVPEMVDLCMEETQSATAVAVLIAVLIDGMMDKGELGKVVLGKMGLPAFAGRLEVYFGLPETGKQLKQGVTPPNARFFTPAFVQVYRDVVPAAKKHLVRLMSGATSGREQELAKLIQLQEQIIEDLQHQMTMKRALGLQGGGGDEEEAGGEWKRKAEQLEKEVLGLKLRLEETEGKAFREITVARQEAQGAVDAYLHSQERLSECEDRIHHLSLENDLLRSSVPSTDSHSSSHLFKLTLEKEHAEREAADLRSEIASLRTALRKIAGGKRRIETDGGGGKTRGEEGGQDVRVELVFQQIAAGENTVETGEIPTQEPTFPIETEETRPIPIPIPVPGLPSKPDHKPTPPLPPPSYPPPSPPSHATDPPPPTKPSNPPLEKPILIEQHTPPPPPLTIEPFPQRTKLFLESPFFPDISSFIEETVTSPSHEHPHTAEIETEPLPVGPQIAAIPTVTDNKPVVTTEEKPIFAPVPIYDQPPTMREKANIGLVFSQETTNQSAHGLVDEHTGENPLPDPAPTASPENDLIPEAENPSIQLSAPTGSLLTGLPPPQQVIKLTTVPEEAPGLKEDGGRGQGVKSGRGKANVFMQEMAPPIDPASFFEQIGEKPKSSRTANPFAF